MAEKAPQPPSYEEAVKSSQNVRVVQVPVVQGTFDAGARFSKHAPKSIPPPPPGIAPNAQQLAVMQNKAVEMPEQKKGGFWKGSGSGGVGFF